MFEWHKENKKMVKGLQVPTTVLVCVVISNLQEEEALRCFLDQFISDILRVKLGPELYQQRVVPFHILSCNLGLAQYGNRMPESRNSY